MNFSPPVPCYTQNQYKATLSRKYDKITIPLAICQAKENSCLVEKPSSSSSSSDTCRLSFESDIAEACLCPGDADVLGRSSFSVTLNCSSYNQILFWVEAAELSSY